MRESLPATGNEVHPVSTKLVTCRAQLYGNFLNMSLSILYHLELIGTSK